jgi:hypothetical protein
MLSLPFLRAILILSFTCGDLRFGFSSSALEFETLRPYELSSHSRLLSAPSSYSLFYHSGVFDNVKMNVKEIKWWGLNRITEDRAAVTTVMNLRVLYKEELLLTVLTTISF